MRRTITACLMLAASQVFACSPPTSPLDLAGVYTLRTVNDRPLPYVLPQVGATVEEVLEDTFTLNPSGTYAEQGRKRLTTAGVVTIAFPIDAGTFTRRGDAVSLQSVIFPSTAGSIRGGVFTLVIGDLTLVYRK